jgi:hypothetical protein
MRYRHIWKTEVRRCVDKLGKREFTLSDMYLFIEELRGIFPQSKNVDARIRENL